MDVFIKSFNRPYYLDRCIQSVIDNVTDDKLRIIVLDDGTAEKYLTKIAEKHPSVEIRRSSFHKEKTAAISAFLNEGVPVGKLEIPAQFWLENIRTAKGTHFLLIEDDFWFTGHLDINSINGLLQAERICLLKLFHIRNDDLIKGKLIPLTDSIFHHIPKLFTRNNWLFQNLFIKNSFYFYSLLLRTGVCSRSDLVQYYAIYYVAGAIFSKAYYLKLWENFEGMLNESYQLSKAMDYFTANEGAEKYCLYQPDIISTSFTSSATNMFKNINLNVFTYNHILNEAWLNNEFDNMSAMPEDIDAAEITRVLACKAHPDAKVTEWEKWVNRFKSDYRLKGFKV